MNETRVMARIEAMVTALPPDARARVSRWYHDRFPVAALSDAERASRYRDGKRHDSVTPNRHEPVTQSVTTPRDETPKRTKVSNNTQGLDYTPGFRSFWSVYPKRVGKGEAFRAWRKAKCEEVSEVVVQAVREQLPYLNREGGEFTPLPATWLKQRRWEDSPPKSASLPPMFQEWKGFRETPP